MNEEALSNKEATAIHINEPENDPSQVDATNLDDEVDGTANENNHSNDEKEYEGNLKDDRQQSNFLHQSSMESEGSVVVTCFPHSSTSYTMTIPLFISVLALVLTGVGSWNCNYFNGATIPFTSARYGLWSLEDADGKCQLWDQLFFSYNLGPLLRLSRFFSMVVQLDGLALTTVMTQALQFHAISWVILLALVGLFLASIFTSGLFNLWTFFFLSTYVLFTLIVRFLFIHPVHRRISARGCKIIIGNYILCSLFSFLTLIVLRSDFCTCQNISSDKLEGRNEGEPCEGHCTLGVSGGLMIAAGLFWGLGAIAISKYGIQPEILKQNERLLMTTAHYSRESMTTQMLTTAAGIAKKTKQTGNTIVATTRNVIGGSPLKGGSLAGGTASSPDEYQLSSNDTNPNDDDAPMADTEIDDVNKNENDTDEKEVDTRTIIQKICFDYRVTARTRREKCSFWSCRCHLIFMMTLYVTFIVALLGSFYENYDAATAPDTIKYFVLDEVCAFDPTNSSKPFESFASKQDAIDSGYVVAHCGKCGNCSNPLDIHAYVETRQTVAMLAKKCGRLAVFGTYEELSRCLENKIGFSTPCTGCWADNMINTATFCLFTCMKTTLTGVASTNNIKGLGNETIWLNQCIFCDEKMSGPGFVQCSGVARRRLGITSEIERNPEEQCKNTDIDWVNLNYTEQFPGLTFESRAARVK